MDILIVKVGATGDVVRTTPLLRRLSGQITWLTERKNAVLLEGLAPNLRCFSWEDREKVLDRHYSLVINLEDTLSVAQLLGSVECSAIFGAYASSDNSLQYTENSKCWFDLSLISSYGKQAADRLKLQNRRTYQDMVFGGLSLRFAGEPYLLPEPIETGLSGDIAIAADAGPVWQMKKWAHYGKLQAALEAQGLTVNVLPKRASLLEHLSDVKNHKCLVGGDSLPMHFALGTSTPCVTLFTCTSPWEIYGYGVQKQIVSPLLKEFFYKRGYDERATTAISVEEVLSAVMAQLETRVRAGNHAIVR